MINYNEVTIDKWNDFEDIISKYRYREMLYRGQSESEWGIETSLYRLFDDLTKIFDSAGLTRRFVKNQHEKNLISQFQMHAHLYFNILPQNNDSLEWLAMMQHHSAPTRLVDVTTSPYIASFFALERGNKDSSVFTIDPR